MSVFLEIIQTIVDVIYYLIPYRGKSDSDKITKIIAHRGFFTPEIKENTMLSFQNALEHGLWGIEFDVRWTKDHVPVICHDKTTGRVFDKDIIVSQTSFEDLRNWIPEIPTLKEVVEKFGKKIHLFIELKDVNYTHKSHYKKALQETLKDLKAGEDFHFLSLSMDPILNLDAFERKYYLLVANLNFSFLSEMAIKHKIGGITGHYVLLTEELIKRHKEHNQIVGTGFIRTKNLLIREKFRGVEFVFTNHPQNLLKPLS